MVSVDDKQKFAVFIDFDNIEIGVKSTLRRDFDVECILEGLKERGEIVAKIAYSNWSRQSSATRALSENGVQMVQRDSTPRGDKNGADINLALDALEMAFTRDHINAFAIVSGDSDFMALVNKLKQYNKRVYIVGGKAFTSTILQRNCHEFISYESLLDLRPPRNRRGGGVAVRLERPRHALPLAQAVPLIDRALLALERRGARPQLGLLKSTLLQLDPAFSERDYGASSFSSFMEKLEESGVLKVKTIDGHLVVERKAETEEAASEPAHAPDDAIPHLTDVLKSNINLLAMGIPEKEVRALMNAAHRNFDPTSFGFQEFSELLNFAADKGLVRIEADASRRGLRYYPGDELPHAARHGAGTAESGDKHLEAKSAELAAESKAAAAPADGAARTRRRKRSRRRRPADSASGAPANETAGGEYEESSGADSDEGEADFDDFEEFGNAGDDGEPARSAPSTAASGTAGRASKRSRRRGGVRKTSKGKDPAAL